jgi:hypothetical protein
MKSGNRYLYVGSVNEDWFKSLSSAVDGHNNATIIVRQIPNIRADENEVLGVAVTISASIINIHTDKGRCGVLTIVGIDMATRKSFVFTFLRYASVGFLVFN